MPVNGSREAFEALNLATLNVASVTMMVGGGLLWAFDVSGMRELRTRMRKGMGFGEGTETEANEEFEEWLATTLARKEEKRRARGEAGEEERK